jgi:hypothetical protein
MFSCHPEHWGQIIVNPVCTQAGVYYHMLGNQATGQSVEIVGVGLGFASYTVINE